MKNKIIVSFIVITIVTVVASILIPEKDPLTKKLEMYTSEAIQSDAVDTVSVYVKDLSTGKEYGVDEDTKFVPASVLKVGLFTAYLKESETQPELLNVKASLTPELKKLNTTLFAYPVIKNPIEIGKEYTVEQFLTQLIKESDNDAVVVLEHYLPVPILTNTLSTILQYDFKTGDLLSPKQASLFFESLYTASYLNKETSDIALETLTDTNLNTALVAGVPSDVRVAHKYGVLAVNNYELFGLNDCGIVYTESPYSICVMTTGKKISDLEKAIADISRIVYEK